MVETVSIGVVITLCTWVWSQCRDMIDAPEEFKKVRDQTHSTLGVLEGIKSDSEKKGSIYEITGPNASKELRTHMKGMKRVLKNLKRVIEEYTNLSPLEHLLRGGHLMRKLPALRQSLLENQQPLQLYMLRILAKNDEEARKAATKATAKANAKLSRIMDNHKKTTEAQAQKLDEILRQVKKLEEKRSPSTAAIVKNDSQTSTKMLRDDLVKQGIPGKDVQDNIKEIKTYLKADKKAKQRFEEAVSSRTKSPEKITAKPDLNVTADKRLKKSASNSSLRTRQKNLIPPTTKPRSSSTPPPPKVNKKAKTDPNGNLNADPKPKDSKPKGMKETNSQAKPNVRIAKDVVPAKPKGKMKVPEQVSLLFVDDSHGAPSTMAQAYTEILRLKACNDREMNPFNGIHSAGLSVQSDLVNSSVHPKPSRPGALPETEAINSIFSGNDSSEFKHAKARLLTQHRRGITVKDFSRFDYIVAIDEDSFKTLKMRFTAIVERAKAANQEPPAPKFRTLYKSKADGKREPMKPIVRDGKKDFKCMADWIKPYTEQLLKTLGWNPPRNSLENGGPPYRSQQMAISLEKLVKLAGKKTLDTLLSELELKTECKISVDRLTFDDGTCVVTVTAQREALPLRLKTVRRYLE